MKFLTPSLLIILLFILGGVWFKSAAPVRCPTLAADAKIFVLTGDARRIPFATRFLDGYPDRHLFIVGAGTYDLSPMISENLRRQITTESESKTTYENAFAIREIANSQNFRRLVLITTADHMNRSNLLIRRQLPDVKIITCPVPLYGMPASKRLERWGWEYIKYLGTLVGIEQKK